MQRIIAAVAALLTFGNLPAADDAIRPAEAILVNARIWTVDSAKPEAQALAIFGSRILAVGSNSEIEKLAAANTRRIDAQGRRVLPGFYDSHVHILGSGMRLSQVALKDAPDESEFGRRLQEFDRKLPRERWLVGGDWDHDRALRGELPTAALIDKYVADRPVLLRRYDGHMAVANTKALALANITAATPDPAGGVIYRKSNGREPSGVLRDQAMGLVARLIPAPSDSEIVEGVMAALAEARAAGVTSVQDMDGSGSATRRALFRLYQQMERDGKLTLRIDLRWPLSDWKELADLGVRAGFGSDFVRIGGLKGFADGSLGSSTAKMFASYRNEPGNTGVWVTPRERLREWIQAADAAGLSVAVHAIGDEANAGMLEIYGEVARINGPRDRRFRIEHSQHLRPEDYRRFAEIGVIASMQPFHVIDDGRWAEGRIGPERCASSYAYASLLKAGAKIAFGSDWAVAPLNPLLGIDAAVHRRPLDSKDPGGWFPMQRITVVQAIEAFTLGSAYAGFEEADRGSLAPGKLADLVIVSHDILDPAVSENIKSTKVLTTMVGGKIVYDIRNKP